MCGCKCLADFYLMLFIKEFTMLNFLRKKLLMVLFIILLYGCDNQDISHKSSDDLAPTSGYHTIKIPSKLSNKALQINLTNCFYFRYPKISVNGEYLVFPLDAFSKKSNYYDCVQKGNPYTYLLIAPVKKREPFNDVPNKITTNQSFDYIIFNYLFNFRKVHEDKYFLLVKSSSATYLLIVKPSQYNPLPFVIEFIPASYRPNERKGAFDDQFEINSLFENEFHMEYTVYSSLILGDIPNNQFVSDFYLFFQNENPDWEKLPMVVRPFVENNKKIYDFIKKNSMLK